MNNKILSVSVACYNVEQYLHRCLSSCIVDEALRQYLEIIIVNDGSKDGTLEIAKTFCEKYPELFRIIDKENNGYGSTINASVNVAEGKYLKLLDADDWYNTVELEKLISSLRDTDSDIVFTDFNEVDDEGTLLRDVSLMLDKHIKMDMNTISVEPMPFAMHGLLIKTDLFRDNHVEITEKCFFTDTEFVFYSFAYASSFVYYPFNIYQYRLGRVGQSVSRIGMAKHWRDGIIVAEKLIGIKTKNGKYTDLISARACLFAINALLACNTKEQYGIISSFDSNIKKINMSVYDLMAKNKSCYYLRKVHYHFRLLWTLNLFRKCK